MDYYNPIKDDARFSGGSKGVGMGKRPLNFEKNIIFVFIIEKWRFLNKSQFWCSSNIVMAYVYV